MDLCGFALGLLIALVMVALAGHLLWLLGATIFNALFGTRPPRGRESADRPGQECIQCGERLLAFERKCPSCGLDRRGATARELRDLEITADAIDALVRAEDLSSSAAAEIHDAIRTRRKRLAPDHWAASRSTDEKIETVPLSRVDDEPAILPVIIEEEPAEDVALRQAPASASERAAARAVPSRQQTSWGQLLAGFMEERNILWGELVGGMLIVGCSIALVISLWQRLEAIPYFPFLIFAAITAALFGAGLYTLSHWKLEATSRGLLTIATLLTPLDFLVLLAGRLSRGQEYGPIDWGTEAVALAVFSWMVFVSARILVGSLPGWGKLPAHLLLSVAIVGASASQLLVPRWLDSAEPFVELFALMSLAPVIPHALAAGLAGWGLARQGPIAVRPANSLFLFLGQTTFAALVALGFIAYWSEQPLQAFQHLAVPITLAGLPLLFCGALVSAKLVTTAMENVEDQPGLNSGLVRWTGTVIALAGMLIMFGGLVLGWPRPLALIAIGTLNAAAFTLAALAFRLPHGHGPALAALAVAFLTAFHVVTGDLPLRGAVSGAHLLRLAAAPSSAMALLLLAMVLAATSEWLAWADRRLDAICHVFAAGVAAVLAMILVVRDDPATGRGALVFGTCALVGFLVNRRWQRPWLTGVSSWAMLGGMFFLLSWCLPHWSMSMTWAAALLTHSYLAIAASILQVRRDMRRWSESNSIADGETYFATPLVISAMVGSVLVLLPLGGMTDAGNLNECGIFSGLLAGVWFIFAFRLRSPKWFAAGQGAVTLAVLYGCTIWLREHQDANHVTVYLLGMAGLGLYWLLLRRAFFLERGVPDFIESAWAILERRLQGLVTVLNLLFAYFVFHELPSHALIAWILQGILALTFLGYLWEGRAWAGVMGWTMLAVTLPLLVAQGFAADLAYGQAARWLWGFAFLVASALIWSRKRLLRLGERLKMPVPQEQYLAAEATVLLLVGTVFPILLLSLRTVQELAGGNPPAAPVAGSLFDRLGPVVSFLGPLLMIVLGLVGHGLREKSPAFIFWAGLVLTAAVVSARLPGAIIPGQPIEAIEAAFLIQLAVLTLSLWALLWLWLGQWRDPMMLDALLLLAFVGHAVLFVPALVEVLSGHVSLPGWTVQAGSLPTWLSWIALATTAVWSFRKEGLRQPVHALGTAGLGLAILCALTSARWDTDGWLSFYVLTLALTLLAFVMLVLSWTGSREPAKKWPILLRDCFPSSATRRWVEGLSAVVVVLSLVGIWEDPWRPYLSGAVVLSLSVLFGAMALWTGGRAHVYASGLLFNVVAFLIWQANKDADWLGLLSPVDQFLLSQILGLASASAVWSLVKLASRRSRPELDLRTPWTPFAHLAGVLALIILVLLTAAGMFADLAPINYRLPFPASWWALAVTGTALLLTVWDPTSKFGGLPVAPLYVFGLVTIGLALHWLALPPAKTAWAACVLLAIYAYEVSAGYHLLPRYAGLSRALRLPVRAELVRAAWFLPAQGLLSLTALALSIWICLTFAHWEDRLFGPLAAALLTSANVWAVKDWPRLQTSAACWGLRRAQPLVYVSLALVLVVLVEAGWTLLDPNMDAPWLHRTVALFVALALGGAFYATRARRLFPEAPWRECLGTMSMATLILAGVVFLLMLGLEFALYDPVQRRTPMEVPSVLLVAGVLIAAAVAALRIAVSPPAELSTLSDQGRMRLVWLAEFIVVAIFLHVRLNRPDWVPAVIGKYWPLLIMALGFAGVGLAEIFRRRGLGVIAEPLQRTGIFLPLLPLLAYLVRPLGEMNELGEAVPGLQPLLRNLRNLPEGYFMHALLWFLLGMLYLQVAVMRRTSTFAFLACLAANFGLWVVFAHQQDLTFLLHPQLWLIPLGLIVLAAEHWHRDSLGKDQSAGLRYFGLLLILLSSSADMFITGLGNSVVLPLVLAVLSVAGVLAGIVLRVRAFLFLGVTFLFLVLFAQIWHAAVDRAQTWVWWASGIVLGAAILALFAVFEKRRNDVLRIVEDIKHWE